MREKIPLRISAIELWDKLSRSTFAVPNTISYVSTGIELYDRSMSRRRYGIYGLLGNVFLEIKLILLWLKFNCI